MARKNLGTKITARIKQLDYVYERILKNIKVLKEIEQHSYSTELDRLITQQNLSFLKPEEIIEDKIDSTAILLEKYYSGVENIFESIAVEIDDYLPNKGGWHQQLLEQMSKHE